MSLNWPWYSMPSDTPPEVPLDEDERHEIEMEDDSRRRATPGGRLASLGELAKLRPMPDPDTAELGA